MSASDGSSASSGSIGTALQGDLTKIAAAKANAYATQAAAPTPSRATPQGLQFAKTGLQIGTGTMLLLVLLGIFVIARR